MSFIFICSSSLYTQVFEARVLDKITKTGIASVEFKISNNSILFSTDQNGHIVLSLEQIPESIVGSLVKPGYEALEFSILSSEWRSSRTFELQPQANIQEEIAIVQLEDAEGNDENNAEVYSLLSSSKDPLDQAAAFQFGSFRFRMRGLDNLNSELGINGFILDDLEIGSNPFYIFSGQNAVTRYSDRTMGLKGNAYSFGSAGLNQMIQFNPATYRKGLSSILSISNRAYLYRVGVQYASGQLKGGLSILAGVNRRWSQESVIEGSFYDAWGAYVGMSKTFGKNHQITLLVLDAPVWRGKNSPATKEVYQLAGNNLYNSYWGYQNGEKRNSRTNKTNIPIGLLNYSVKFNENLILKTGLMYMKGVRSDSNLDWSEAPDPRPDYYQKLPSYIEDPIAAELVRNLWKTDVNTRQLKWHDYYAANYANQQTIVGANGDPSSTVTGKRAVYVLNERHYDPTDLEHFGIFTWNKNRWQSNTGYRIEQTKKENYQELTDLLGADFYLDTEDFVDDIAKAHPDIDKKNKLIRVGDRYAYDYISHQNKSSLFSEWNYKGKRWDALIGGNVYRYSSYRDGKFKNAIFANSFGESSKFSDYGFGGKSVLTYKFNGRNYIQGSAGVSSEVPLFDQVFINPQWRSDILQNIENSDVSSFDIAYYYRSPELKIKFGGFWVNLNNQIRRKNFYLDESLESTFNDELADGAFINAFYRNLDQRHIGLEGSIDYDLGSGFEMVLTGSAGDYIYTGRPDFEIYDQYSLQSGKHTVYIKNFYVPGTPQLAGTTGLKYNFKSYGFATLNISYLDQNYVEVNPLRRTTVAVAGVERNSAKFEQIIAQEKLPAAWVLDAFVYKSYKINDYFMAISLGVNNILNKKDLISGGFEQNRFDYTDKDPNDFPNKYFYLQGINYFLNLTLSL